jgi:hypothetical protein
MSVATVGYWAVAVLIAAPLVFVVWFAAVSFVATNDRPWRAVATAAMRIVWWSSTIWLVCLIAAIVLLMVGWAFDSGLRRHEAAIIAALLLMYSWPAAVGVLLGAIGGGRGVSGRKRVIGLTLPLVAVGLLLAFDQLQSSFR